MTRVLRGGMLLAAVCLAALQTIATLRQETLGNEHILYALIAAQWCMVIISCFVSTRFYWLLLLTVVFIYSVSFSMRN